MLVVLLMGVLLVAGRCKVAARFSVFVGDVGDTKCRMSLSSSVFTCRTQSRHSILFSRHFVFLNRKLINQTN